MARRGKGAFAIGLVVLAVLLSMFDGFEPSPETWLYWSFSRIMTESHALTTIDRSPLYVLYVSAFRWIGFPLSVMLEYTVSMSLVVFALVWLFRSFDQPRWLSVLAALVWLPFVAGAEPPVQALSVAALCAAWAVRRSGSRKAMPVSYGLMVLAGMLRMTFLVVPLFVAGVDIWRHVRSSRAHRIPRARPTRSTVLAWSPVVIGLVFVLVASAYQSSHPWNNVFGADATYFPVDAQSLVSSHVIQSFNARYIAATYPNADDKDFWDTNGTVFGGARTALGALRYNPRFIITQTFSPRGAREFLSTQISLMSWGRALQAIDQWRVLQALWAAASFVVLIMVYAGAWLMGRDADDRMMMILIVGLTLTSVLSRPGVDRYYVGFVPLISLGALYWARRLAASPFVKRLSATRRGPAAVTVLVLTIVLLSNGAPRWASAATNLASDVASHRLRPLEYRTVPSMKAAYPAIVRAVDGRQGIMTLDYSFVSAFTDVPLDRIYSIWEIPPFGRLGDPVYTGLRPDRVRYLLVSPELKTVIGEGTNAHVRYVRWLAPYIDRALAAGARVTPVPGYGELIEVPDRP